MKLFQFFRSKGQKEAEPETAEGHINTVRASLGGASSQETPPASTSAEPVAADASEDIVGHIETVKANLNWRATPSTAAAPHVVTDGQPAEVAPVPSAEPLAQP